MKWKDIKNIINKELKESAKNKSEKNFSNWKKNNIKEAKYTLYKQTEIGADKCKCEYQMGTPPNATFGTSTGPCPCPETQQAALVQGSGLALNPSYGDIPKRSKTTAIMDLNEKLKEAEVTADDKKFNLRTGVNKNPTKLGIKIQFEPKGEFLSPDVKNKLEVALQEKLNQALMEYDMQVSKDTDVPRPEVIGFFIPLAQVKNLIVKSLTGQKVDKPSTIAPEPEGEAPSDDGGEDEEINEMINEALINEMRVRDLNEISKVVIKEDFYAFINAGNNVLRTLEENGRSTSEAKKYLGYLVKHNIM